MSVDSNYPVLIKSKDEFVAMVPLKTLIQHSVIFKSMLDYNNYATGNDGAENCEANEVTRDIIKDIINNVVHAVADESDVDNAENQGKVEGAVEDIENDKASTKDDIVTTLTDPKVSETKIDTINIDDFNIESVRILFNYMAGHRNYISGVFNNFHVLKDVFYLCEKYEMHDLFSPVFVAMNYSSITMDNLIEVLEFSEEQEKSQKCQKLSKDLYEKVINFSRCNFASWQIIVNFVGKNLAKLEIVSKIFKALKHEPSATLAWNFDDIDKLSAEMKLPSHLFIVGNLGWKLVLCKESGFLEVWVECYNPNSQPEWSVQTEIKVKLFNYKALSHVKSINGKFCAGNNGHRFLSIRWKDFTNFEQGFIRNGKVKVEAEIKVLEAHGIKDCLGVPEESFGFDLSVPFIEIEEEQNNDDDDGSSSDVGKVDESPVDPVPRLKRKSDSLLEDPAVVLTCQDPVNGSCEVLVRQSLLINESTYFKSMFSTNWKRMKISSTPSETESESLYHHEEVNTTNIKLNCDNYNAVKILFDYLTGFKRSMEYVNQFEELTDMLWLCDYYDIQKPVPIISHKINTLRLTMKNLSSCKTAIGILDRLVKFKPLRNQLMERFKTFLRANFASWQTLVAFIADTADDDTALVKIAFSVFLHNIGKMKFSIKFGEGFARRESAPLLFSNLLWSVCAGKPPLPASMQDDFFGLHLKCQGDNKWSVKVDATVGVLLTDGLYQYTKVKFNYDQTKTVHGKKKFMAVKDLTRPEKKVVRNERTIHFGVNVDNLDILSGLDKD